MHVDPIPNRHAARCRSLRTTRTIVACAASLGSLGTLAYPVFGQVPAVLAPGTAPVVVRPLVPEPGLPPYSVEPGTANLLSGADGSPSDDPGIGTTDGAGGGGGNVGGSDVLTTMLGRDWGEAAAADAQSIGVNPSALAATCVAESGCNSSQAVVAGQSAQGTFQMQPAAYQEGLAAALAANPDLASQVVAGPDGRFDPTSAAIAASGYLLQGAQALQRANVVDPTVLQTRALYVFGPGPGPSIATADNDAPLSNYVSASTISQNHWPATETVGQWRASASATIGNAANQSVLTK